MPAPVPPPSCKVYTPLPLARAMVGAIYEGDLQRWLEPSCGRGVFVEALDAQGVTRSNIVGIDIDRRKYDADRLGQVTRGIDFLSWSARRTKRFDCVVGNPPYVAINRLPKLLRLRAAGTRDFDGEPIGMRANTWYPFLLQAIRSLRDGGNLAFVLPAACEFADYSAIGRSTLTSMFARIDLIRSRRPLFEEVAEGAAVLIARNKGGDSQLYRRHEVNDLNGVIERLQNLSGLTARTCPNRPRRTQCASVVKCADVFDVRIGGVTGDASYFVLSESQRKARGLPKSAVTPVVSRSRHIAFGVQEKRVWKELYQSDERMWLFYPSKRSLKHEAVLRYLRLDEREGGCHTNRYKIRNRDPWYLTPMALT